MARGCCKIGRRGRSGLWRRQQPNVQPGRELQPNSLDSEQDGIIVACGGVDIDGLPVLSNSWRIGRPVRAAPVRRPVVGHFGRRKYYCRLSLRERALFRRAKGDFASNEPTTWRRRSAAGYQKPRGLPFLVTSRTRRGGKHAVFHRTSYRARPRRGNRAEVVSWLRVGRKTE